MRTTRCARGDDNVHAASASLSSGHQTPRCTISAADLTCVLSTLRPCPEHRARPPHLRPCQRRGEGARGRRSRAVPRQSFPAATPAPNARRHCGARRCPCAGRGAAGAGGGLGGRVRRRRAGHHHRPVHVQRRGGGASLGREVGRRIRPQVCRRHRSGQRGGAGGGVEAAGESRGLRRRPRLQCLRGGKLQAPRFG